MIGIRRLHRCNDWINVISSASWSSREENNIDDWTVTLKLHLIIPDNHTVDNLILRNFFWFLYLHVTPDINTHEKSDISFHQKTAAPRQFLWRANAAFIWHLFCFIAFVFCSKSCCFSYGSSRLSPNTETVFSHTVTPRTLLSDISSVLSQQIRTQKDTGLTARLPAPPIQKITYIQYS